MAVSAGDGLRSSPQLPSGASRLAWQNTLHFGPVNKNPHILVVEDQAADFELMLHTLRKGGMAFTAKRVDADDELLRELDQHPPDVVLSDNALKNADSFTVLKMVRERDPDVPCVLVTGGMQPEKLTEVFERGADECVFKDRLAELVFAVRRALRLSRERRRARLAEFERDQLHRELSALRGETIPFAPLVRMCRACKKVSDKRGGWESVELHFLRHYGIAFTYDLCSDCVETYYSARR